MPLTFFQVSTSHLPKEKTFFCINALKFSMQIQCYKCVEISSVVLCTTSVNLQKLNNAVNGSHEFLEIKQVNKAIEII